MLCPLFLRRHLSIKCVVKGALLLFELRYCDFSEENFAGHAFEVNLLDRDILVFDSFFSFKMLGRFFAFLWPAFRLHLFILILLRLFGHVRRLVVHLLGFL